MNSDLVKDRINFGKYQGLSLDKLLRDRKYCIWLVKQDWFCKNHEYLYNRVLSYKPMEFFCVKSPLKIDQIQIPPKFFLDNYHLFYLTPLNALKIHLTDEEKICYKFYTDMVEMLREKAKISLNIKAPKSWLKNFEKSGISRDIFKEFLYSHDLPNITDIVEDIKKAGGIEYKGAKSFLISKQRSLQQEKFWEDILKKYYGEEISCQYKYKRNIFDFIRLSTELTENKSTLYECKLGFKDFDEKQYRKYILVTGGNFKIVYLISNKHIVDISNRTIYTTNETEVIDAICCENTEENFRDMLEKFEIKNLENIQDYFLL
jgi:hypothetical protein